MCKKNSVPGNALVLTIVIALILAILCTSLILLAYYNRQHQLMADIAQRLDRNLESSTQLLLSNRAVPTSPQHDTIDLFGEESDSVMISTAPWGIFQTATVTACNGRFEKQRSFIFGSALPDYMNGCLYMADHKRPLSLVGHTVLTGDVYLSKAGVKATYINQRGFDNDKLVDGKIQNSQETLPEPDKGMIDYLYQLTKPDSVMGSAIENALPSDSMVQRFTDTTAFLYSKTILNLDALTLKGHIIIKSDSIIEVGASTVCEDVILVAPVIRFEKGFTGSVQAIATDSLIAEPGCMFEYPSALILLKRPAITWQNVMRIEKGCQVNGIIITKCENADPFKTFAEIQPDCRINGIAYIMGFLAFSKATVSGTLLTDFFIYKTPSMLYENHLVDVSVNRQSLSRYFIGSGIFKNASRKEIIKWVQ
jgi:hypothetical protein